MFMKNIKIYIDTIFNKWYHISMIDLKKTQFELCLFLNLFFLLYIFPNCVRVRRKQ